MEVEDVKMGRSLSDQVRIFFCLELSRGVVLLHYCVLV